MEKYFSRVSHVIEARKVDSRVRFMLQDLVDLRQVSEFRYYQRNYEPLQYHK